MAGRSQALVPGDSWDPERGAQPEVRSSLQRPGVSHPSQGRETGSPGLLDPNLPAAPGRAALTLSLWSPPELWGGDISHGCACPRPAARGGRVPTADLPARCCWGPPAPPLRRRGPGAPRPQLYWGLPGLASPGRNVREADGPGGTQGAQGAGEQSRRVPATPGCWGNAGPEPLTGQNFQEKLETEIRP